LPKLFLLFVFISTNLLLGQGQLLPKLKSGLLLNSSYSNVEGGNGIGVGFGYSFKGIIEIGILFANGSSTLENDNFLNELEIDYKTVVPMVSLNLYKGNTNNDNITVGVDLGLSVEINSFKINAGKDFLSGAQIINNQKGTFINLGPLLYLTYFKERIGFSPYLNLRYTLGSSIGSVDIITNYFSVGIGIVGAYEVSDKLLVTPSLSLSLVNGSSIFGIGLGALLRM